MLIFLLLQACGPGDEGDDCVDDHDCGDGLVCLHWEDSEEGACFAEACADNWTGYGCDLGDTGRRRLSQACRSQPSIAMTTARPHAAATSTAR